MNANRLLGWWMVVFVGMAGAFLDGGVQAVSLGDPFDGNSLRNPAWKWTIEPKMWDVGKTKAGWLHVKGEVNRNLWADDTTNRLYQEFKGNFDIETHLFMDYKDACTVAGVVALSPKTKDHNGRPGEWVTLKLWGRGPANGNNAVIQYQKREFDNAEGLVPTVPGFQDPAGPMDIYMRLKRENDGFTSCWSTSVLLLCPVMGGWASDLSDAAHHVLATIEWIRIPEGEFIMGSTPEEVEAAYQEGKLRSSMLERHTFEAEVPQHRVFLDAYEISRHEITNAQYRTFIEEARRPKPRGYEGEDTWADETLNGDSQPVVGVTWFDAQAFAEWIGASLPSEAQWERAARGTDGRKYPWGNSSPTPQHANFARRHNRPMPFGQFPKGASPEGVEDLSGNVWEWCLDEYDAAFYKRSPATNPLNLRHRDVLRDRVIRGGSYDLGVVFMRSALRFRFYPLDSTHNIGFRVVRKVKRDE